MGNFIQIDADPLILIHLFNRVENADHRRKSLLILSLSLLPALSILASDLPILHIVHHHVVHFELQDCYTVH